jgi:hypothetical protein
MEQLGLLVGLLAGSLLLLAIGWLVRRAGIMDAIAAWFLAR